MSHLRGRQRRDALPPSPATIGRRLRPDALYSARTPLYIVNLRDTTRDIVGQVEQRAGYPVEVVEDRALPAPVGVRRAGRRNPASRLVRYSPTAGQPHSRALEIGEFSAVAVVSVMVAAFEQFAPGTDLGVDLAREYEMTMVLHRHPAEFDRN